MKDNPTNGQMKQAINQMMQNKDALNQFSSIVNMPEEAIRDFFKALLSSPQMSDDAKTFVWDGKDEILKAFLAGQEKGESNGFWKGVAAGFTACLAVAIGLYFEIKDK